MSQARTSIRWPLYASAWALIALMGAVAHEDWFIVICAALATVMLWGIWLSEGDR